MAKQYFYYFLSVLAIFLVEVAAIRVFQDYSYLIPQLTLVWVAIFVLPPRAWPEAIWLSFAAGLLLELFSGRFFGGPLTSMLLTGVVIFVAARSFISQEPRLINAIFLVVAASLLFDFSSFGYQAAAAALGLEKFIPLGNFVSPRTGLTIFLNLLFFYPLLFWLNLFTKTSK